MKQKVKCLGERRERMIQIRKGTNDQEILGKVLDTPSHQRNANKTALRSLLTPGRKQQMLVVLMLEKEKHLHISCSNSAGAKIG